MESPNLSHVIFDYRTQYFFPIHIVTFGHAAIFFGLVFLTLVHWIAGVIILLLGFLVVSLNFGISINTTKKVYHDYLFILGFKKGKKLPYGKIEYLYITSSRKTTTMQLRAVRNDIVRREFNGYIKFSEDEKIHLLSSRKKKKVLFFLEKMAGDLKIEIKDFSNQ